MEKTWTQRAPMEVAIMISPGATAIKTAGITETTVKAETAVTVTLRAGAVVLRTGNTEM